ncbi:hypothetical protein [Streptomyces sp. NPDC005969]|uniref:hypothetical protein n=1 Tax=Streptomyces sp. NPDC005969 TaxID=3156722 RepID=UPI003400C2AC
MRYAPELRCWGRSQREFWSLLSIAEDLRATEVMNGVKRAYFVLSKNVIHPAR